MSFILDALKKSETDRQRQTSPALFEVKVAPPRRGLSLWVAGLAALFVINVVVVAIAWFVLRAPAAPPGVADTNAAATSVIASPAAPPGMVTVPATVTIPTTVNIPASSAPTITVGSQAVGSQPGAVAPSGAPPLAEEPLLSGREPAVPPDYNANDYAEAVTPTQARSVDAARVARGDPPSRDEVQARGAQLPELRLDMHVYSANPVDRFVFINMRKLREGESLPDGTRVDSITKTGVQLSYRGTRFSLDGN